MRTTTQNSESMPDASSDLDLNALDEVRTTYRCTA